MIVDLASAEQYTREAIQRRDVRSIREGYIWIGVLGPGTERGKAARATRIVKAWLREAGLDTRATIGR